MCTLFSRVRFGYRGRATRFSEAVTLTFHLTLAHCSSCAQERWRTAGRRFFAWSDIRKQHLLQQESGRTPKSAVNFGGQTACRRSYVTLPADLWPPTRHWRPGYSRQSTITLAAALQTPTRAGPTPNISQACWRQSSASLTAARQPPTGLFGGHSTAGYLTELWRQQRQVPTADGRCGLGGQSVSRQSCVRLLAARLPPN